MFRQSRIDAPGALHHVIVRGIERLKKYLDDQDCHNFLDRLAAVIEHTATICYAWALIPNHFHLLLRTSSAPPCHRHAAAVDWTRRQFQPPPQAP